MAGWIDDADCYRCPVCGFETHNPNQHGCKCPKCGFVADKDKPFVNFDESKFLESIVGVMYPCIPPNMAPVKHASWKFVEDLPDGDGHWMCTNCGVEWVFNDGSPEENEAYYCPKCGARMGGGKHDS